MEKPKIGWAITALADQVGRNRDAKDIANAIALVWDGIDLALRPIIGKRGVDALFRRCVEVTALSYPWIAALSADVQSSMDLQTLRDVLLRQELAHFAAASDAMLAQFHAMLAELIGLSLTERLLRPVLDPLLNDTATKDT
jgi:hypothetical protein